MQGYGGSTRQDFHQFESLVAEQYQRAHDSMIETGEFLGLIDQHFQNGLAYIRFTAHQVIGVEFCQFVDIFDIVGVEEDFTQRDVYPVFGDRFGDEYFQDAPKP